MASTRITIPKAAERTGFSYWTIRRRISDGTLHAWRMPNGRGIRLDSDEVDQLLRPIPTMGGPVDRIGTGPSSTATSSGDALKSARSRRRSGELAAEADAADAELRNGGAA